MRMSELTRGLKFPEGPVALDDGSVLFVEVEGGTIRRWTPEGRLHLVADVGGGPNGAALGPDGALYVCNNGGFRWRHDEHGTRPAGPPDNHIGGSIQRVDLTTGRFETLYDEVDGRRFAGPNDLVFDRHGGFWFTDYGKSREHERVRDLGAVYYATADGTSVREVLYPIFSPNGIALSPDEKTLYVADTESSRLWAYAIEAPGTVDKLPYPSPHGGRLLAACGDNTLQRFDSMAVDAAGNICVATLMNGGITVVSPDGASVRHQPIPDLFTTNLCFGGPDMKTAYVTLSAGGSLLAVEWDQPGLRLNFQC